MTLATASKVTVCDGDDVAEGKTTDAAWVSGSGTVISLLKKIASAGGSAVSIADGADTAQGTTTDLSSASTIVGILKAIKAAVQGTLTTTTSWASAQHVIVDTAPSTAVTGAFYPATQPVSLASAPTTAVTIASLPSGAVTNAGTFAVQAAATLAAETTKVIGTVNQGTSPWVTQLGATPTFSGRAATFRTPGRAGTTGQKLFALHNATGSTKVVHINMLAIDLVQTVVKAVTVLPPVIRAWKVTVLPTNGTALTKTPLDSTLASSSSVTVFGDASADGTVSASALTATLPAGTILTQEYAPRLITAAGYEMFDRTTFFDGDTFVTLRALEGIVVFLDYVLATQNPITDMWVATCEWSEF